MEELQERDLRWHDSSSKWYNPLRPPALVIKLLRAGSAQKQQFWVSARLSLHHLCSGIMHFRATLDAEMKHLQALGVGLKKKGKLNYWLRRRRRYYGRKGYLATTPLKHCSIQWCSWMSYILPYAVAMNIETCAFHHARWGSWTALPAVHKRPLKKPPRWPEKDMNQTKSHHCANIETQAGVLWHCSSTIPPCAHQEHILLALMVYGHINILLKSNRLPFRTF